MKTLIRKYLLKKYEKFPQLLSVELTTACNSRCIMCPRLTMKRKIEHMKPEIFYKVINDCVGQPVKKINFFWFGDPLCNPQFLDYLRYARQKLKGVKFYISTNAGLLKKEISDAVLNEKLLDVINFDIDGITKETHESIRVGVNFDDVVKNVKYFMEKRKQLGLKKPQTRVTIIRMDKNQNEVDAFVKFWKPLADKVDVNDYNTWGANVDDRNVGQTLEKSQKGHWKYPCIHPWNEVIVSADGIAGLCCMDYNLTAPLGNVMQRSLYDIWHGPEINKCRASLEKLKYEDIECCAKCNGYIYQDDTLWAKVWRSI